MDPSVLWVRSPRIKYGAGSSVSGMTGPGNFKYLWLEFEIYLGFEILDFEFRGLHSAFRNPHSAMGSLFHIPFNIGVRAVVMDRFEVFGFHRKPGNIRVFL